MKNFNFWQKLLMAILIILIEILLLPTKVQATVGQTCCTYPLTYSSTNNDCFLPSCTGRCTRYPINCNAGNNEICDGIVCIQSAVTLTPSPTSAFGPTVTPVPTLSLSGAPTPVPTYNPCKNTTNPDCGTCTAGGKKTWTALGCLSNTPADLVSQIIGIGAGIAGGLAFLYMLFGAAQIVLSQGIPEKIQAGKEVITSAIIGLVFIFCSILILRLIGVSILGIPGWS